jgi:hypothetical protein
MSPTSPIRRAAPEGPMPLSSSRPLPVAAMISCSWAFAVLICLSMLASSVISSEVS